MFYKVTKKVNVSKTDTKRNKLLFQILNLLPLLYDWRPSVENFPPKDEQTFKKLRTLSIYNIVYKTTARIDLCKCNHKVMYVQLLILKNR